MASETLTLEEAYRCMSHFLEAHWGRTRSDDIAALLGDISTLPDGKPADPAAWSDFLAAAEKARSGSADDVHLRLSP